MSTVPTLSEFITNLWTKPESEKVTSEEFKILQGRFRRSLLAAGVSSLIGGAAVWAVSRGMRLDWLKCCGFATGGAIYSGLAVYDRSVASTFDHILGLDGTRLQKELANVIIKGNKGEPWRLRLMSKHFYPESVYEDSSDRPQIKWRSRHFFSEIVFNSQMMKPAELQKSSHRSSPSVPKDHPGLSSDPTKIELHLQHHFVKGQDAVEDPFEFVFGTNKTTENAGGPAAANLSSRAQIRRHKRSHRRRRSRAHEDSLEAQRV